MSILDKFSLTGRIALVTAGAGPLFGSSLSEGLAEAGAKVIVASRSLERNLRFAEKLTKRGYDVHGMQLDIRNSESIEKLHSLGWKIILVWECDLSKENTFIKREKALSRHIFPG